MSNFSYVLICSLFCLQLIPAQNEYSLNGTWEAGYNRTYNLKKEVPGLFSAPDQYADTTVWYRKKIVLPEGKWTNAGIILKGARFHPAVYVNGVKVSESEGGMTWTYHPLQNSDVKPGNEINIEIALRSLNNLSKTDASYIPPADHWRSNISSSLWDDVILKTFNEYSLSRIIPFVNFDSNTIRTTFEIQSLKLSKLKKTRVLITITNAKNDTLVHSESFTRNRQNSVQLTLPDSMLPWTPEKPVLYYLTLELYRNKDLLDKHSQPIAFKKFEVKEKQFYLNNKRYPLRAGTVVWHRWVRDPDAAAIAWDTNWFTTNIIENLKNRGANTLRFHLGNPPEAFLDLCDKHGLIVQYEWSFFHGMNASYNSLKTQWQNWLDLAMKHPSVSLIHPYNETDANEVELAWKVLDEILKDYPPLVLADRDVMHIHKYWWSLFENVGLYYDSYKQFPKAIMADEFGGNYLDSEGNPGLYPTVNESFLRFLGQDHSSNERLKHQSMANTKIAEYWRRTGAAGFSPFTILGSPEDGNHWFLGNPINGMPKPVWNDLTVAWAPVSASMELWNRNYLPGQKTDIPVYFFNDTDDDKTIETVLTIKNSSQNSVLKKSSSLAVDARHNKIKLEFISMPDSFGSYLIEYRTINSTLDKEYPVISKWPVNILSPIVNEKIKNALIFTPSDEYELTDFLKQHEIRLTHKLNPEIQLILLSEVSWNKLTADNSFRKTIYDQINAGTPALFLDAGPKYYGEAEPDNLNKGSLQGIYQVKNPQVEKVSFINGIELLFKEVAEPESHVHPFDESAMLWNNLSYEHTRLWNGLRGGLIVPATTMDISGLNSQAFLELWDNRGAFDKEISVKDPLEILGMRNYYAFELQGFYEYSYDSADNTIPEKLRSKVKFLVEDAPALAGKINPNAPVNIINLSHEFGKTLNASANIILPLVSCGKSLTKTPVYYIGFQQYNTSIMISQLITRGRLHPDYQRGGLYGIKYDPAAVQMVLNMMDMLIK